MPTPSDMPPKKIVSKPWLSVEEQVSRLKERGLVLNGSDERQLEEFLWSQNYYRFSGYFKQFYLSQNSDTFAPGTSLKSLRQVYEVDVAVRLHIYQGIQQLEPLIRTRLAYRFSAGADGPTNYLLKRAYEPSRPSNLPPKGMKSEDWSKKHSGLAQSRDSLLASIEHTLGREELYLQHFRAKGQEPPLWAMVEALSLGDLSKMISVWKDSNQVDELATDLGFSSARELRRAVGNLNFFRNLSAHHNRLWGRTLTRSVARSPWPDALGSKGYSYDTKSPLHILRLIGDWVDYVRGNSTYSSELWDLLRANQVYFDGMKEPAL